MLSAGELLALDERRLRVALWPGTRTGANLARGEMALLCFIATGTVLYVRGRPRALRRHTGLVQVDAFEIEVDSVEADAHAGLPVTDGITFGMEGVNQADLVGRWRSQLEFLRAA
jgi:hypothetical protein